MTDPSLAGSRPEGTPYAPCFSPWSLLSAAACAMNPLLFFFPGLGPSPYFCLRGPFAFRGQDMLAGCNPISAWGHLGQDWWRGAGLQLCS